MEDLIFLASWLKDRSCDCLSGSGQVRELYTYIPLSPWYNGIPTCFDLVWFRHLFHRSCFKSIDSALGRTLIRSVLGIEASMCPEGLSFALSNQSSADQRDERWYTIDDRVYWHNIYISGNWAYRHQPIYSQQHYRFHSQFCLNASPS